MSRRNALPCLLLTAWACMMACSRVIGPDAAGTTASSDTTRVVKEPTGTDSLDEPVMRPAFSDTIYDGDNVYWGIICTTGTVLDKGCFVINHDDRWKVPYWVGYYLSDWNLQGSVERTGDFRADPEIPVGSRAELKDYSGGGYDRGHMAPAGCFKRSVESISTSFLLSNMCPQTSRLNRGRWRILEEEVREHVVIRGEAWVITGCLFLDELDRSIRVPPDTIGANEVAVPSHCFKAILSMGPDSGFCAYAFVMPNDSVSIPGTSVDYMMTIDDLEQMTGYDFFYRVPDPREEAIESRWNPGWPDICTWVLW